MAGKILTFFLHLNNTMNHRDTKFFFKYNKFNFWCFVEKEKTNRGGGDKWSKQMRKEGNFLQF